MKIIRLQVPSLCAILAIVLRSAQMEAENYTFRGEEDEGYRISRRFRNPPLSVDKSNIETAFANL